MRAVLLIAILVVPGALALQTQPGPVYNGDFLVGLPGPLDSPLPPLPFDAVGSALPGATERDAAHPAAGWSWRSFSGEGTLESTATWGSVGILDIRLDGDEHGARTPILAQAVGRRPEAGAWRDPRTVTLEVRHVSIGGFTVRAFYAAVEDPDILRATTAVTVPTLPGHARVRMDFPPEANGTMTEFFLAFDAYGESRFMVTNVTVEGAVPAPSANLE